MNRVPRAGKFSSWLPRPRRAVAVHGVRAVAHPAPLPPCPHAANRSVPRRTPQLLMSITVQAPRTGSRPPVAAKLPRADPLCNRAARGGGGWGGLGVGLEIPHRREPQRRACGDPLESGQICPPRAVRSSVTTSTCAGRRQAPQPYPKSRTGVPCPRERHRRRLRSPRSPTVREKKCLEGARGWRGGATRGAWSAARAAGRSPWPRPPASSPWAPGTRGRRWWR